ncbi:hypothetical protein V8C42DRAFT_207603 [Trichoderma barbatum]
MLFDSTYKTNRFNMPLFNICSSTSLNKHEVFAGIPHILCHWHIHMNVIANTKKHFPKPTRGRDGVIQNDAKFDEFIRDWRKLVTSKSEDSFKENLTNFKASSRYPREAIDYCIKTWIDPWQTNVVRCFIDRYPHYGHVTTSIVESAHASLKRFLQQRSGADLKTIFEKLKLFWHHQSLGARLEAQQRRNKVIASFHFLLQELRFQVSPVAIDLIQAQIRLLPRQGALGSACCCTIQQRGRPRGAVALQSSQPHQRGRGITSSHRAV